MTTQTSDEGAFLRARGLARVKLLPREAKIFVIVLIVTAIVMVVGLVVFGIPLLLHALTSTSLVPMALAAEPGATPATEAPAKHVATVLILFVLLLVFLLCLLLYLFSPNADQVQKADAFVKVLFGLMLGVATRFLDLSK